MHTFKVLGSVGVATLFAAYGCSVTVTDTGTTSGTGGTGGGSTSTVVGPGPTSTAAGPTSSSSSGMPMPDESTGCADAVELAAGVNSMDGVKYLAAKAVLAVAEDKDYFKFTAKKGDWINLLTQGGGNGDTAIIDPVITLFSADGLTPLAEVDDSFPRIDTNSNFYFRIPADGTYCVEVQEFSTWKNVEPKKGDDTLTYDLVVVPYDADNLKVLKGREFDKEPNNDVAAAQLMSNLGSSKAGDVFSYLFGALEPKTDKDLFKLTTPKGAVGLAMNFAPSGVSGNGSTGNIGLVSVWNADHSKLIAQLDYNEATAQLSGGGDYGMSSVPVLQNTTYLFETERKAGTEVGSNDFYSFFSSTQNTLNPQEVNDMGNGTAAGAEVLTAMVSASDPKVQNRFLGGSMPAMDTDFWKFEATAGEKIIVACSSRRAGSGVNGFAVTLLDSASLVLQTEVEKTTADLAWSDSDTASMKSVLAKTGTYYVKLSGAGAVANGATSMHYLCGVATIAP